MGSTKWGSRRKWDRPNARDEIGNYEIGCDQFVAHAIVYTTKCSTYDQLCSKKVSDSEMAVVKSLLRTV